MAEIIVTHKDCGDMALRSRDIMIENIVTDENRLLHESYRFRCLLCKIVVVNKIDSFIDTILQDAGVSVHKTIITEAVLAEGPNMVGAPISEKDVSSMHHLLKTSPDDIITKFFNQD